ncbi:glycosyltransferase [Streptomyces niveus]|uniref:glycosyltransferase n=1 Tax=Streptomyces niveus TaxID=193462 RepID=UPI0035DAF045
MRETANQFIHAGWDVTVVTIAQDSWERDSGIDPTLLNEVDSRVRTVELSLSRLDLETDIRLFDEERAASPNGWLTKLRNRQRLTFPEPNFGEWRGDLERAALDIHAEHPADLLLASCVPYVNLAAAWKLWEEARVPYAVDFRDGWSIDVIDGVEAFSRDSEEARWEKKILDNALSLWVVNDPIADHYRARYPEFADRVHVVRNGYDADSAPGRAHTPDVESGLTFGYLGTVNFSAQHLETVLNAWRTAREHEPLLANARFEVRGHIGNGAGREANRHTELLKQAAADGVVFGGPAAKAEVASVYASWDALVLILIGGRFVTSGKVYEYMATGLPIVSAHVVEHDASNVLHGHPLWTGAIGLDEEKMAEAFAEAARMAISTSDELHAEAMAHADRFTREKLMTVAVRELVEAFHAAEPAHGPETTDTSAGERTTSTKGVDVAPLTEKSSVSGGTSS